jgi:hypothetical protein
MKTVVGGVGTARTYQGLKNKSLAIEGGCGLYQRMVR